MSVPTREGGAALEPRIARLLTIGTYASVAAIAVGVVLMAATGRSPLDVAPAFEPARVLADLAALRPAGFLWLGLVLVLATPAVNVLAALAGFVLGGERGMAAVAVAILVVIAVGVLTGIAGG